MSDDENMQRDAVAGYVIALMAAALHEERAAAKPTAITWEQVWRLAARHSIAPMTLPALPEGALDDMPASVSEQWRHAADMALFQQVGYDVDREAILADCREAGLSWIPLKGIMVATYYPQPGMRSMSDQDIVVGFVEPDGHGGYRPRGDSDEARRYWRCEADKKVDAVMRSHGYTPLSDGKGRDRSYGKAPLHFEMHRSMVSATEVALGSAKPREVEYYANPWAIARPQGEVPGEFRFDTADEYVFHIDHMSKHYRGAGFGLRFLADEYLYCMRFPETVNSAYVAHELRELGLEHFEQAVRELSLNTFDHLSEWRDTATREQRELFDDVLSGGTYGSLSRKMTREMARQAASDAMGDSDGRRRLGAIGYVWGRLFPPRQVVETYYPQWSRNRFTRFLLVFHRALRGIRNHPHAMLRELRLLLRGR